jgi:hypothetical protein
VLCTRPSIEMALFFCRPIAAYGAFDQPTYKVDLTPFVPVLADGKNHTITLDVASAESYHGILGNWWLSGLIQVVQDQSSKPTTGKILSYIAPPYAATDITGVITPEAGYNDVNISVSASHQLSIISHIVTGSGKSNLVKWTQDLSFHNFQSYTQDANYQVCRRNPLRLVICGVLLPTLFLIGVDCSAECVGEIIIDA